MSEIMQRAAEYEGRLYLGNEPVQGRAPTRRDFFYGVPKSERIVGGIIIGGGVLTALLADPIIGRILNNNGF